MRRSKRVTRAFSLVEMMVVAAIIGILATLAVPRFRVFIARSRMGEATHNLGVIDKLQKSYNIHYQMLGTDDVWYGGGLIGRDGASSKCADADLKNSLGFRVEDCSLLRYFYTGSANADTAKNSSGGGDVNYRIYPGCDTGDDEWQISRATRGNPKLDQTIDVLDGCRE